ncbi:NADP-dependent fatty aldehyde dehydrogenase domain protein, partial [Vibrio parahaemolyticus V-223/04]
QMPHSLSS